MQQTTCRKNISLKSEPLKFKCRIYRNSLKCSRFKIPIQRDEVYGCFAVESLYRYWILHRNVVEKYAFCTRFFDF